MKGLLPSTKFKGVLRLVGLSIGILMIFLLIYSYISYQQLSNSEAYQAAIHYLEKSEKIHSLTGGIRDYGIPTGREASNGQAYFFISVKGSEENVSVKVDLDMDSTGRWQVTHLQIR